MFSEAVVSPDGRRRFATARGIAFEAKQTADGTWHGYPVPWESIPPQIREEWLDAGKVLKRDLRLYRAARDGGDIHWALNSDVS